MYNAATAGGDLQEEDVGGCIVRHKVLKNGAVQLHYVEAGKPDGPVVLLLHGFPNFWYSWVYQLKPLADAGFHIIAPDLRGYNLSSKPKKLEDYSKEALVSDIVAFADEFAKDRKLCVVGHDWGGALAWSFTEEYPERVARLLTLNIPHPKTFAEALSNDWAQKRRSWYMYFFQLPWLPEWVLSRNNFAGLRAAYQASKPIPEELIQRHVDALSSPGSLTAAINYYRAIFRLSKPAEDGAPHKCIDVPVKTIWGQQDTALGSGDMAKPPEELVPNAEPPVLLPQGTHWVMWDEAEAVNQEMLAFLKPELSRG